jgi:putative transcriptional regulator
MKSLQGHFLVAALHQHDPIFARAVILVVQHSRRAAFGVIVDDSSENRGRREQRNFKRRLPARARLYFGGPVTGPLMAVHTRALFAERQLLPGVFFSATEKNVLSLMGQTEHLCKVFTGYAGWGPGQLDYELEQGIWRVVPATPAQIFSDGRDLWQQLSRQVSRLQLQTVFNMKHIPADPLLN